MTYVIPNVPAAGHVSVKGYWHPGSPRGCSKCFEPSRPAPTQWNSQPVQH
jgi:hypothetical protein